MTARPQVVVAGLEGEERLVQLLQDLLLESGLTSEAIPDLSQALALVRSNVESEGTGPAVVVLAGSAAVATGREMQQLDPSVQLVFVADWSSRDALQRELRLAGMTRGWVFAFPDHQLLIQSIRSAIRSTSQRRQVRTTLGSVRGTIAADDVDAVKVRNLIVSDAVLAAILREAGDVILAVDDRGRILAANRATERLFGFTADDLAGRPIAEVIIEPLEIAGSEGKLVEGLGRAADGSEIALEINVSRVVLPQGRAAGFVLIARDIRERLAIMQELQRQYEFTSTIVNGIGDGIFVADANGDILFVNPAAEEMLGWNAEELKGHNAHQMLHSVTADGTELPAQQCPLLRSIANGIPLRTESEVFLRKDGTKMPVACVVTPVRLEAEVVGGVFNFHDISQHKLAQQQLHQEKEALTRISRAKDEFLATVSHELRTPLTAILGWLQLVSKGELEKDEMTEAFEAIESSARAQASLVNDLLDVSRVISGKLHLAIHKVDLADVVVTAAGSLRPSADSKGIALKIDAPGESLPVCGDPARLQQVVWNLLSNAIKFTPAGGEVRIMLERSNESINLIVADTGQGIPREVLPHVFDQFRQAEGAVEQGGLGLGLTIVKSLVERHDGSITIESEGVGRGTKVTIVLPYDSDPAEATSLAREA